MLDEQMPGVRSPEREALRPGEGFAWGFSGIQGSKWGGSRKVSPDLGEAQMGFRDLGLFQVKPLQGSMLKEWYTLSPAFAGVFEPCHRAG